MDQPVFKLSQALDAGRRVHRELETIRAVIAGPGHFDAEVSAALIVELRDFINLTLRRAPGERHADTGISRDSTLGILDHCIDTIARFREAGELYLTERGDALTAPAVNRLFTSVVLDLEYLLACEPLKDAVPLLRRTSHEGPYLC